MADPAHQDRPTSQRDVSEGTDPGDTPDGPPAGIAEAGVEAWLTSHIAGLAAPFRYHQITGGHSNLTFEVTDAGGRRVILRRPPTGPLLPTAHDMSREHRIIAAVGPAGIPAPAALGYCPDPEVTGAPFYVMDFVDGVVLRSPEDVDHAFSLDQRAGIGEGLIDVLARLHAVDPDAVGLGDLSRREGYIARQLKRWYAQYQATRDTQGGPDVPDIDAVHAALVEDIPEQGPATVVHGDYRLDNTMISPDGTVAAVLDWELCTLGDPLADVGTLMVYWTEPGEVSPLEHSPTTAPGFPTRADLAARYAERSGRDISVLDFYVAFAYWKLACILAGVYARYAAGAHGADAMTDFHSYPATIRYLGEQAASVAGRLR
jgi:aminoglycoside phosphotransferase (APT) family kinase protein